MKRPDNLEICNCSMFFGYQIKDSENRIWTFPDDFDIEIKNDEKYVVYYLYHDSADNWDSTTYYDVQYMY